MLLAVAEVLGFPASLLTALPLPTTLLCSTHEGGLLVLQTHRTSAKVLGEYESAPAFVGPELAALVLATEQERAGRPQLEAWCRRKVEQSGWQLTRVEALGAVFLNHGSLGWTTERVFRALGVELREVVL